VAEDPELRTLLDDVEQRNWERGLLGYTGTYNGKPVSVQGTGMGCPGATIVFDFPFCR